MNHEWQYSLTPDEVVQAVAYAKQQTSDAAARGGKHKPRGTNWTEERVVTGFKAEIALAALLGVTYAYRPYSQLDTDVAGYEIRATLHNAGWLTTYHDDKRAIYILATINAHTNVVRFRGWQPLYLMNTNENYCSPDSKLLQPCYSRPQHELWPMDMLPETNELMQHRTDMVPTA